MKKLILALALGVVFVPYCLAQDVKPVTRPTPPASDGDVVKISTNLIQVDVSVTDSKGKAVPDLKPDEIEIYENGKKQNITHFQFVSSPRPMLDKQPAAEKNAKTSIPETAPAPLQREQVHRTIALVVDDLGLSFDSIYSTRRALKKFVAEQMQDGDLVAIMMTGQSLGAFSNFTTDKRVLYAAIDRIRLNLFGSGGMSSQDPVRDSGMETLKDSGDPFVSDAEIANDKNFQNAFKGFRSEALGRTMLGTMSLAAKRVVSMPGRKSVVLFSNGLNTTLSSADDDNSKLLKALDRVIEEATRSSVVFYAVDARGLQTTGFTAADEVGRTTNDTLSNRIAQQTKQIFDTQGGLVYLTERTGGFTTVNSNDFNEGIRRVLDDQSYYLVGYEPDSDTFDPTTQKFNKLEIKIARRGAKARYRSGFSNFTDDRASASAAASAIPQKLDDAILSPFAENGIGLRLSTLFGNDRASGSYVTSLLYIDGTGVKFTDDTVGKKKAEFQILAVSYDRDGKPVDTLAKAYTIHVSDDSARKLADSGFVYRFTFPVTKPGAYQYRVALRDRQGGSIGTASQFLAVPDLKNNELTLSGILLENMSVDAYQRLLDPAGTKAATDPAADTAIGKFRAGSVLRYTVDIYNARTTAGREALLRSKVKLYCNGKLVLNGDDSPVELANQTASGRFQLSRALVLGTDMPRGEYILQILIRDDADANKKKLAAQTAQFEVVD